jgi:hypothetical protein
MNSPYIVQYQKNNGVWVDIVKHITNKEVAVQECEHAAFNHKGAWRVVERVDTEVFSTFFEE